MRQYLRLGSWWRWKLESWACWSQPRLGQCLFGYYDRDQLAWWRHHGVPSPPEACFGEQPYLPPRQRRHLREPAVTVSTPMRNDESCGLTVGSWTSYTSSPSLLAIFLAPPRSLAAPLSPFVPQETSCLYKRVRYWAVHLIRKLTNCLRRELVKDNRTTKHIDLHMAYITNVIEK